MEPSDVALTNWGTGRWNGDRTWVLIYNTERNFIRGCSEKLQRNSLARRWSIGGPKTTEISNGTEPTAHHMCFVLSRITIRVSSGHPGALRTVRKVPVFHMRASGASCSGMAGLTHLTLLNLTSTSSEQNTGLRAQAILKFRKSIVIVKSWHSKKNLWRSNVHQGYREVRPPLVYHTLERSSFAGEVHCKQSNTTEVAWPGTWTVASWSSCGLWRTWM